MPLLERLKMTLRADAHGVIDSLEDRALLLKQHVRDAEVEVQRKRAHASSLLEEEKRLEADRKRAEAEHERHDCDAQLAISAGEDALAKKALARALPLVQLLRRIRERAEQNQLEQRELSLVLATQESELSALRSRVEAFLSSQQSTTTGASFAPLPVSDDEIELELLRRKRAQQDGKQGTP